MTDDERLLLSLLAQVVQDLSKAHAAIIAKFPDAGVQVESAEKPPAPRRERISPDGTFETLYKDATPGAREPLAELKDGAVHSFDDLLAVRKASYEAATGKKASDAESRAAVGRSLRWAQKVASEHGFSLEGDKDAGYRLVYPDGANTPAPTPEPAWVDPFLKLYED